MLAECTNLSSLKTNLIMVWIIVRMVMVKYNFYCSVINTGDYRNGYMNQGQGMRIMDTCILDKCIMDICMDANIVDISIMELDTCIIDKSIMNTCIMDTFVIDLCIICAPL